MPDIPISSDDDGGPYQPDDLAHPVPDSPCSIDSDGSGSWIGIPRYGLVTAGLDYNSPLLCRVKKNWIDVVTVPLLMAYTTRLIFFIIFSSEGDYNKKSNTLFFSKSLLLSKLEK